jgi:hypothetical protein
MPTLWAMPFLYHARPPDMRSETLYPLNALRRTYPDVYERERKKYAGREAVLGFRIPILDVLWNDTLHLSPVHPHFVARAWRAAELSTAFWERDFFAIPVVRIAGLDAVWFASEAFWVNNSPNEDVALSPPAEEFSPFDAAAYDELPDAPLPPLSFALAPLVPVQEYRKETISRHLTSIRDMPLDKKTSQRVRLAILDSLTPFPEHPGQLTMNQLPTDLTMRLDLVGAATDWALREFGNRDPQGVDYSIRLYQENEDVFRAETDIGERFRLTEEEVDRVLERAVLAVGALNERFELMESYNAVSGLRQAEVRLLDVKLAGVMREIDPDRQEQRLTRILELANLPDPETAEGTVNVERLLAAREHEELVEFRQWLRTLDDATDDEIRERVDSLQERISEAVYGSGGKAVRFAATAAADLLPFGGLVVGAVDEFLLEKVLPEPGPVSFLGATYRSLFE